MVQKIIAYSISQARLDIFHCRKFRTNYLKGKCTTNRSARLQLTKGSRRDQIGQIGRRTRRRGGQRPAGHVLLAAAQLRRAAALVWLQMPRALPLSSNLPSLL
jgi:hypothetical protein